MTNKLLLEAGLSSFNSRWGLYPGAGADQSIVSITELIDTPANDIPVPFFTYRSTANPLGNDQQHNVWRASASYVTGAHSMKVGYQAAYQVQKQFTIGNPNMISYTFLGGAPTSLTQYIPSQQSNRTRFDAFYAQDQWTINRLTLQGGLRYEHAWSWHPEGENGALTGSRFLPNGFIFPRTDGVTGYHDITPRMGVAYDVFGNGKTAIKVNYSKYLQPANNESNFIQANPGVTFQNMTTRTWGDANSDRVPDCDLNSSALNGECGPWQNSELRQPVQHDPREPRHDARLGQPAVRLAVGRGAAAGSPAAPLGGRGLQPPVVEQLLRDRQPGDRSDRLRRSSRSSRRPHPDLPTSGQRLTFLKRNGNNPLGATSNYRTFQRDFGDETLLLAGDRLHRQFAHEKRPDAAGRLQHRRRAPRPVRRLGGASRAASSSARDQQVSACKVDEEWQMNWRGLVTYTIPEDRRPGQRHPAVAGQHRAVDDRDRRGHQRRRAGCKLHRDAGHPRGQRSDAVCARRDDADGQSACCRRRSSANA